MALSKTEVEFLTQNPFKLLNVKTLIHDNSIVGYELAVFLKDEESVDKFAEWFKKEILKKD